MLKCLISEVGAMFLIVVASISSVFGLVGCKERPNHIFGLPVISMDGEKLAFKVGYLGRDEKVFSAKVKPYVLKLGKDTSWVIPVQCSGLISGMAWRRGVSPPELSIIMLPSHKPGCILTVRLSDDASIKSSQVVLPDNLIVPLITWNPAGQILAAYVNRLEEQGACLGISYDGGKIINVTDIKILRGNLVWANDETLYLQNGNDILEVDISGRNPRVTKTIVSAEGVYLMESLNGKVVYILGNEIYCGDQLLYRSDKEIGSVDVDGCYVAFKTDNYVVVVDEEGNVINKRAIEQDTKFIGISVTHKFVYLMKNYQSIQRYSFDDDDDICIVYKVSG